MPKSFNVGALEVESLDSPSVHLAWKGIQYQHHVSCAKLTSNRPDRAVQKMLSKRTGTFYVSTMAVLNVSDVLTISKRQKVG